MALTEKVRRGKWFLSGQILSASAVDTGTWQSLDGVYPFTITVTGSFVGTVTIFVDNDESAPTDANVNHGTLTTFTAPGVFTLSAPIAWIKAAVTAYTSGSITVTLEASESQAS